jgi:hypothetical protein
MNRMANSRYIHIVGAGMAGLSAALQLTLAGEKVVLYEAAPFAGGRCRSFLDRELGCVIDNGNHLVLSGNAAIHDYLFLTDALETMGGPGVPIFPFMDVESGQRWVVQMNKGRFPLWIFDQHTRIPGTKPADYLSALKLLTAGTTDTVAGKLDTGSVLYRCFWAPLTIGALNTEPETFRKPSFCPASTRSPDITSLCVTAIGLVKSRWLRIMCASFISIRACLSSRPEIG